MEEKAQIALERPLALARGQIASGVPAHLLHPREVLQLFAGFALKKSTSVFTGVAKLTFPLLILRSLLACFFRPFDLKYAPLTCVSYPKC